MKGQAHNQHLISWWQPSSQSSHQHVTQCRHNSWDSGYIILFNHNFCIFSDSLNTKFLPPNYFIFPLYARDHLLLPGWPHTPKRWWTQPHSPCLANVTFSMTSSHPPIPPHSRISGLSRSNLLFSRFLLPSLYALLVIFIFGSLSAIQCILDITDNKSWHN